MAENEVGRVSLGVELSTDPLSSQAADLERKVTSIAEKAGEKAGKKFADEAAKAFERNSDKIGEAGEKAGEEAGKGAGKGLKSGSKTIETETGAAGEKAGKSFFSRFSRHASGTGGGLKAIAGKIGKALVAAFAAKKIFDFGKMAVNLGSDLNEVQNVVDSTFGQGSQAQKAVDSFAKNAATQFGLSETMAKRYSGTFGAMGKAFGFTSDQAADMGTTLAGLSGDVASFYNISQDEAYAKLKGVFTGESEALKDLGVVMTQTALDQYALQHGFGQTTKTMSEQEKVALRYRFVLDKLSTASGDFARTSDGWANQVRLLKLQFESLAATIGQVLIAALTPAIKALNSFMGVLVKAANTFKSFVFSLFGLEASAMGTGSAGALPEALGNIGDSAGGAADSLGNVGDAAKGAGKDASKAANEIKRSLASFDKITKLAEQKSNSGSGSGGSGGSGGGSGSGGSGGAGGGAGSLGDTSSALTNTAWSVGESGGPLDKIIDKLKALKDMFVGGFWEGLGDLSVFDSIQSNIESIGQHLKNIFTDPAVVKAASDYADKVAYNLGRMAGATVSVGATIVDNITGGIEKYLEQHEDDIKQALIRCFNISGEISTIVGDFSVAFADVFSVFRSDDAKQITADLINIFATGFDTVVETTAKFTRDVLNNLTKPFVENKDKIKTTLEGAIGQISTVVSAVSDTVEAASRVIGKYYDDHVKPLLDSLGDGISRFISTYLDGYNKHIKPVLDELASKFADVCEAHIIPMMESLGEAIGSVVDLLRSVWETVLQPLVNWAIKNIMPVLGDMAEALGGALLDAITVVADGIKAFSDGIKPVIDFITDLINAIKKVNFSGIKKDVEGFAGTVGALPKAVVTTISVACEKAKSWSSDVWDFLSKAPATIKKTVSAVFEKTGTWAGDAWEAVRSGAGTIYKTLESSVKKGGTWVEEAWTAAKTKAEEIGRTIKQSVKKGTWISDAWNATKKLGGTTARNLKQAVTKGRWAKDAWSAVGKAKQTVYRWLNQSVSKGKWSNDAWKAVGKAKQTVYRWLNQTVSKGHWSSDAWSAVNTAKKTVYRWLNQTVSKGSWSDEAWKAANKVKQTVYRWLNQTVSKGSWSDEAWKAVKTTGGTVYRKLKITVSWIGSKLSEAWKVITGHAEGGVYNHKLGTWANIPQYASGGQPHHGTMFVAGEAGPEIVGHVGGRTEILNKSQMASIMHAAITNGMTAVSNRLASVIAGTMASCTSAIAGDMHAYLPHLSDIGNGIRSDTAQLVAYAKQAEAAQGAGNNAEVLDLLRRILEILTLIDPDVYIDGEKVTAKIVSIINSQTRATGRPAIIV